MFKFNGFTEKANKVLNLAVASAQQLGHTYIGSEHLLLGILEEGTGVAASVLNEKGITAEQVVERLQAVIGQGQPTSLSPNDFTPRCKRILEMAIAAARSMGHNYVGTEHILMAIIQEGDSYAVRFLSDLGADPQAIFNDTARAVGAEPPEPATRAPRGSGAARPGSGNKNSKT